MEIVQTHKERVNKWNYTYLGTYIKGEYITDKKIYRGKELYIRVLCHYCNMESDVQLRNFKLDFHRDTDCCCHKYEDSLAYYIQRKINQPLDKYWDWDKNTLSPYCITPSTNKVIYIKCTKTKYHGSYKTSGSNFTKRLSKNTNKDSSCPYCASQKIHPKDSFSQCCIDNISVDFLEKYWSEKNTLDPWKLAPRSHKKVWMKCQNKDYHYDYETTCDNYTKRNDNGSCCPLCHSHGKVHEVDSFGSLYPQVAKYWSPINKKTSFEYAPKSNKKCWFICERCGEEFKRQISSSTYFTKGCVCGNCRASFGEVKVKEFLNTIGFEENKDYYLRPDFILPKQKIWIEYDGEFHYEDLYKDGSHKTLVENDNIKDEYAKKHNWKLIRIPYWEFDNIESILENIFKESI